MTKHYIRRILNYSLPRKEHAMEFSREIRYFLDNVETEHHRARKEFNPFENGHTAYAVILEEVEKLWQEIKHPTQHIALKEELVQIAAMCLAAYVELELLGN